MAGLFQPVLQETGGGQVAAEGVVQPSVATQVAPAAIKAVGGLVSFFGERKKAKAKVDAQQKSDEALSRYASQLTQLGEMARTSNVGTSALKTKQSTITMQMIQANPALTKDILGIQKDFASTSGLGKVLAEGTIEERQAASNLKSASDKGFANPEWTEEENKAGVTNFMRIQKAGVELEAIAKQEGADDATKKRKSEASVTEFFRATTSDFSIKSKKIAEAYQRGKLTAIDAKTQLDDLMAVTGATANQIGASAGSTFVNQQMSTMTTMHKNALDFISGKFALEALNTKNSMGIAVQESVLLEDEELAKTVALSGLWKHQNPLVLQKQNNALVTRHIGNIVNTTGENPPPNPAGGTAKDKEAKVVSYKVLSENIGEFLSGAREFSEADVGELDTSLNRLAEGIDIYQMSVKSPKDLKDIVSFLGNPRVGEYMSKSGGMLPETLLLANEVIKQQYVDKIGPLLRKELFNAASKSQAEPRRGLIDGAPLMDFINIDNNSGSIGFSIEAGSVASLSVADQGLLRSQVRELNKKVNPIVNEMVRVSSHLEGHTNYEKQLNNNLERLLGVTPEEAGNETTQTKAPAKVDDSFESVATQGEFKVMDLKEKGFTKEQVLVVLDSLGLTDNDNKDKVKRDIEKVFGD